MRRVDTSQVRYARHLRALAAVGATVLICAAVLSWSSLHQARASDRHAREAYAQAWIQAQRINALRSRATRITDRPPPEPDLVARLRSTLRDAGIAESRLASVSTTRAEPIRDTPFRRVSAPVSIEGVRPAGLARFVAGWTEGGSAWTMTALTLSHEPSKRGDGADTGLYTARFTLENIHIDALAAQRPEISR